MFFFKKILEWNLNFDPNDIVIKAKEKKLLVSVWAPRRDFFPNDVASRFFLKQQVN